MSDVKNYLSQLQDAVFERLKEYGVGDNATDMHTYWTHVRPILSLHLKRETGEGLVKGNKPVTEFQYIKCVEFLNMVLPKK